MIRLKRLGARLLFLPGWAAAAVPLAGYAGLAWVFLTACTGPLAYAAYTASAYGLAVNIAALPKLWASWKRIAGRAKKRSHVLAAAEKTAFGKKYLNNRRFRAGVSLYQSIAVNFLYAAFHAAAGARCASPWFLSLAAYHFLLGALRAYLAYC